MAHVDTREGKWRGNWRMGWVASTLHTTSEHGLSSITTADAHTSAASSRLNWRPRRFKWTRPFRRKTKSGFCACAITFQTQSNINYSSNLQMSNVSIFSNLRWQLVHKRPPLRNPISPKRILRPAVSTNTLWSLPLTRVLYPRVQNALFGLVTDPIVCNSTRKWTA